MSSTITPDRLLAHVEAYAAHGTDFGPNNCLFAVRSAARGPGGTHDAADAWKASEGRHLTGTPPRGAIVYWVGGSRGYGHIAISAGSGWVWSTDIKRKGKFDKVRISTLNRAWPNLRYAGWALSVNGVRVLWQPPLSLARLQNAYRHPRKVVSPKHVRRVQRALGFRKLSGRWGSGVRRHWKALYPETNGRPTERSVRDFATRHHLHYRP